MLSQQPKSTRTVFVVLCLIALFGVLVIAPVPRKVGAQSSQRPTASLRAPTDWLKQEAGFGTTTGVLERFQKLFAWTGGFSSQSDSQKRSAANPVVLHAATASPAAPSPERSIEQIMTKMAALKQEIARDGERPALMKRYEKLTNEIHALARQNGDLKNSSGSQKGNVSDPLVPEASLCQSNSLSVSDRTFQRPNPGAGSPTSCPGTLTVPACPGGSAPIVRYDAFGFNLTGCGFPTCVTISMCSAVAGCVGDTGQNLDSIIYVYRTGGATAGTGTSNPFNPNLPASNACLNLVAVDDDGTLPSCAGGANDSLRSSLTISLGPGHFAVVVAAFSAALQNTGNYHLLVDAPGGGCAVTLDPSASDATVSGQIVDNVGSPVEGAVVNLSGTQARKTITGANGNYRFDNVETNGFYTVTPSRANFSFSPATRSFSMVGNKTDATFTGISSGDAANPVDTAEFFVRQQYRDFLGREPDERGFNFWSDRILECDGDANCVATRRRDVAAAFFISNEFQNSGYFVYRLYKGAFGARPTFAQYLPDRNRVIGGTNLDASRSALADDFVRRGEFLQTYPDSLTNEEFVNQLYDTAGLFPYTVQRQIEIEKLNHNDTRSQVMQDLVDDGQFKSTEYNPAFVLTEYFNYLRRGPDARGYDFWLSVLNTSDPGNYRGMVCSFITSTEYQRRFSSIVSHRNAECGP